MIDFKDFLNKNVLIEFPRGGDIVGQVLSVFEDEIELKLQDSNEVTEIKTNDIKHIEEQRSRVRKSTGKVSGKDPFVEVDGKKIRKKKRPPGSLW